MNQQNSTTFAGAVAIGLRKYADFNGRASRPEFWWFMLFVALGSGILSSLNFTTPGGEITLGTSLASAWSVATLLPTLAAGTRRLRDAGRSWKELFWLLVPIAGLIVMAIRWCEPAKDVAITNPRP